MEYSAGVASATPRTIDGSISAGGAVMGTVGGTTFTFTGNRIAGNAPYAGYYPTARIAAAPAPAHVVVSPDGQALVALHSSAVIDGGVGSVDSSGRLTAGLISGAAFSGTIEASGAMTAALDRGALADRTFGGLRDGALRTSRLANLATRGFVGPDGRNLVAGFVVSGTGSRALLLRGIGPTLASFGIAGALADPSLTLYQNNNPLVFADDWPLETGAAQLIATTARLGAFALPNSRDAAVSRNFTVAGNYTIEINGNNDASGVALVEVYEDNLSNNTQSSARLINLSTRGWVGTGEAILVAGFVIQGNAPQRLLVRAAGPALAAFGVGGSLADPMLNILDSGGTPLGNDDWSSSVAEAASTMSAQTAAGAFPFVEGSRDAAVLLTLQPGAYTAQVAGKNGNNGIALVEIYVVP